MRKSFSSKNRLVDDIIDSFVPTLKNIEFEVDAIDELVLIVKGSEQSEMLQRIGKVRKQVTTLLRNMTSKPDMINSVMHRCMDPTAPDGETRLYLEDIHDHVITMGQNINHYENTLSRAHSNYLAQISIELTLVSNRTSGTYIILTQMLLLR